MLVRDIMTWNVITAPSTIPILEAERLLEIRGFHRLPIVDKGQLVGIVTMDDLLNATPHPDTPMARRQV
ncbi:MAG: CBS domain-containing protein, partial [Dehalococcoidia bacterium]|nr:CBS domain-containing protein [Dehalococcoidia bacterium]